MAIEITANHLERDANGKIAAPAAPSPGIEVDEEAIRRYLRPVEIRVGDETLFASGGSGVRGHGGE